MSIRNVFTGIGDRLLLVGAALMGGDLLGMQRDTMESQAGVIEAQDAVIESRGNLIVILTRWKDLEKELVGLHADHVARLERKASAREAKIENLKRQATLQDLHVRILERRLEGRESRIDPLESLAATRLEELNGIHAYYTRRANYKGDPDDVTPISPSVLDELDGLDSKIARVKHLYEKGGKLRKAKKLVELYYEDGGSGPRATM